jgi:hypothetical protein
MTCNISEPEPKICTADYKPVCGEITVQCIKAPCPAIKETFGNACMMSENKNVKFLYNGVCEVMETAEIPDVCTKEYIPMCGVTQTKSDCE